MLDTPRRAISIYISVKNVLCAPMGSRKQQITADVLMIRPASFCANLETADSNRFQQTHLDVPDAQLRATREFDSLVVALTACGVRVHVVADTPTPATPDALFPNNWVSFHSDGTIVLYPMLAPTRRLERSEEVIRDACLKSGFTAKTIVDLTAHELESQYLEGTGSLVLDRVNKIAYACVSPRTNLDALGDFAQQLDYEIVAFDALDQDGFPIYHTNVLMSIGRSFAVVCAEAIAESQRASVLAQLRNTGHVPIEISFAQMNNFAGNILELETSSGESIVALSERAAASLTIEQNRQMTALAGRLVSTPIPTIENLGGGSVRCMLAEIHMTHGQDH